MLLPQGTAVTQAVGVHKRNTKQDYEGDALTFNLNLMIPLVPAPIPLPPQQLPPPCTTGFLPAQQQRVPTFEDYPDRPRGRPLLPSPAGRAVQRPRCAQPALQDRAGQTRPDSEDV